MGTNFFISSPPFPVGTFGPQPAGDLFGAVPPTGVDRHLTFICHGRFDGVIAIEGSADGVNFDVVTQFEAGADDGRGGPALEFSPQTVDAVIRYIRANFRCKVITPVVLSVGAEQNCVCASPPCCDCSTEGQPGADAQCFHETFDDPTMPGWVETAFGNTSVVAGPPGTTFFTANASPPSSAVQRRNNAAVINPYTDDFCLCMEFAAAAGPSSSDQGTIAASGGGLRDTITGPGSSGGPGIAIVRTDLGGGDFFELFVWSGAGTVSDIALVAADGGKHAWQLCIIGDNVLLFQDGNPILLPPFASTRAGLLAFGGVPNQGIPVSVFADSGDSVAASTLTASDYCARWKPTPPS